MSLRPCDRFEPSVNGVRCSRCNWPKGKHRAIRRALCHATGKVKHRTRAAAAKILNALMERPQAGRDVAKMMTYLCPHCRGWHVGHGQNGDDDIAESHPRHQREEERA